jgi:hypothetical protein
MGRRTDARAGAEEKASGHQLARSHQASKPSHEKNLRVKAQHWLDRVVVGHANARAVQAHAGETQAEDALPGVHLEGTSARTNDSAQRRLHQTSAIWTMRGNLTMRCEKNTLTEVDNKATNEPQPRIQSCNNAITLLPRAGWRPDAETPASGLACLSPQKRTESTQFQLAAGVKMRHGSLRRINSRKFEQSTILHKAHPRFCRARRSAGTRTPAGSGPACHTTTISNTHLKRR